MICIEPDTEHRDVTFFRLARTLAGRPLCWAGACLVGGALVDGGPPATAPELLLAQGLPEREVTRRAVGPEGFLTWFSLGRFSARNFVKSVARGQRPAARRR